MPSSLKELLKNRNQTFIAQLGTAPRRSHWWVWALVVLVVIFVLLYMASRPPRDFAEGERVRIEAGSGLGQIATTLKEAKMIRSRFLFKSWVALSGDAESLQAGDYIFDYPLGVRAVARRIITGQHGDVSVRITILEGATIDDIATRAGEVLEDFNTEKFIDKALDFNGYLFPETYFVLPDINEKELVETMHDQFSKVLNEVGSDRLNTLTPEELRDVVIMASIIEREAAGTHDSYVISGILWKRIEIGMPLQVDASFAYLFDKASSQVTKSDLAYDSPYNTYRNKGLPPGPLGNPGKIALDAALHPASSPYLFYLHDRSGGVHYGKDFDEHVANKRKYLR